ncbi:MAG: hypothetical protein JNK78_15210, partial [Planctomycetes bacterium]|nr:hypothetical protein [Planctomycetota bacterium]
MRLPINFLLYTASLGLLGLSGWNVYKMLPSWKKEVRESAHNDGLKAGKDCLGKGRGTGRISDVWRYSPDTIPWWAMLKTANLVGKVPPPPPKPKGPDDNDRSKVPVAYVATPLEQMFELVSLVSDDAHDGKGGNSHVILRFRPDANVKPPEWWVRENTRPAVGAGMPGVPAMPADVTKGAQGNQATRPPANAPKQNPTQLRGTSSMPMSPMGSEILQKLWVNAAGDPRRAAEVWPMSPAAAVAQPGQPAPVLGTIRLVRVAEDAQSAFFVREFPKQGDAPPPEPKEEQLFKTSMNLPQDVLKALHALQGRSGPVPTASAQRPLAVNPNGVWQDVEVTTKV